MAGIRGFRVAGAALLGLMLAACGGSGGSEGNTGSGTTTPPVQIPTVQSSLPVARAQGPESTLVGDRVSIEAAGSYAERSLITYKWSLSAPTKSASRLDSTTSPKVQFIPDVSGYYKATLVVINEKGDKSETSVQVEAALVDARPVASLDYQQYVNIKKNSLITLDGSKSRDPNGNALSYLWDVRRKNDRTGSGEGSELLTNANSSSPAFSGKEGAYFVNLRVFNGKTYGNSLTATIIATTGNSPPDANAGVDAYAIPGAVVKLDGSASKDPDLDELTYRWSLVSRPADSLSSFGSTLMNPEFKPDVPGSYVIGLRVSDGVLESQLKTVTIIAFANGNAPPSAAAGAPQTVPIGYFATFNGDGSKDTNGQLLTYSWNIKSKPEGSVAYLIAPTSKIAGLIPDKVGEYVVSLVVNDGIVQSEESITKLTATSSSQSILPIPPAGSYCCRVCTIGKACGDSCISKTYSCSVGNGCAC